MVKRRKVGFPRLAVYAVSAAELRRAIDLVEHLGTQVISLSNQVTALRILVERLTAVPTPRGRRRPAAADVEASEGRIP